MLPFESSLQRDEQHNTCAIVAHTNLSTQACRTHAQTHTHTPTHTRDRSCFSRYDRCRPDCCMLSSERAPWGSLLSDSTPGISCDTVTPIPPKCHTQCCPNPTACARVALACVFMSHLYRPHAALPYSPGWRTAHLGFQRWPLTVGRNKGDKKNLSFA